MSPAHRVVRAAQDARCAICGKKKPLVADRGRGLVCRACKGVLAGAGDSPDTLARAIAYLDRFPKPGRRRSPRAA